MDESKNTVHQMISESALEDLIQSLSSGDEQRISQALSDLGIKTESNLYHNIGTLARGIHESLKELKRSMDPQSVTMHSTNISDATTKLASVINMTFEAASNTMTFAEKQGDLYQDGRKELEKVKEILKSDENLSSDSRKTLEKFVESQHVIYEKCQEYNQGIFMTQEYQDLTGQALRKVIKLVTNIEEQLVNLITLFNDQEEQTSISEVDFPEEESKQPLDQDDVDSVLKSLGF